MSGMEIKMIISILKSNKNNVLYFFSIKYMKMELKIFKNHFTPF